VTVRTYWTWETTATSVASARRRARPLGAHGGGEGRGISCPHAPSLFRLLNIGISIDYPELAECYCTLISITLKETRGYVRRRTYGERYDDSRNSLSDECVGKCVPEPSER